jgi:hypothetical protein
MATSVTYEGATMRLAWQRPIWGRLAAIVFLGPSLYLAHFLVIGISQDLSGQGDLREDLPDLLALLVLVLLIAVPGYMLATFRYYVDIDRASGEVVAHRTFGPLLHLRFRRKLTEFTRITIVRDLDSGDAKRHSWFPVHLCGKEGTKPLEVASYQRRQDADQFAGQLGVLLGFKAEDLVDTEPNDPDLQDDTEPAKPR